MTQQATPTRATPTQSLFGTGNAYVRIALLRDGAALLAVWLWLTFNEHVGAAFAEGPYARAGHGVMQA